MNREGESSSVLEGMEVIVFDSCLQRPKDVIFKGLSEEGLIIEVKKMKKKKKKKYREKL